MAPPGAVTTRGSPHCLNTASTETVDAEEPDEPRKIKGTVGADVDTSRVDVPLTPLGAGDGKCPCTPTTRRPPVTRVTTGWERLTSPDGVICASTPSSSTSRRTNE